MQLAYANPEHRLCHKCNGL